MRFHHIGIACSDIEEIKKYMNQLYGVKDISDKIYDSFQEAELCMVILQDGTKLEFVSGKQVEKIVKKRHFLYHICYSTEDINKKIEDFEIMGAKIVSEPKPAVLFEGRKVAFLMTKLGLIELLEEREEKK